jgi:hypothetical protein
MTHTNTDRSTDHDSPWKIALDGYFGDRGQSNNSRLSSSLPRRDRGLSNGRSGSE